MRGAEADERLRRPLHEGVEGVRAILGDDAALVDDDHPLAGQGDFGQDVAGQQDGRLARQSFDQRAHVDDLMRVQPHGGLVQDEHARRAQQGLGEADPLAIPLGQRPDPAAGHVLQTTLGQHAGDLRHALERIVQLHPRAETQERADAHVGVEDDVLREVADLIADLQRGVAQAQAADAHLAARRRKEPRQDAHERGLARAVRPQQPHDLALRHVERHVVQSADPPVVFRDVVDFDHGRILKRIPGARGAGSLFIRAKPPRVRPTCRNAGFRSIRLADGFSTFCRRGGTGRDSSARRRCSDLNR